MHSLSIQSNETSATLLRPAGALALPLPVETAARVVPFAGELRVLINHPGVTATTQLRVLPMQQSIEQLSSLPVVSAGAACCNQELLVTGADALGHPVVLCAAADGEVLWQLQLEDAERVRWPVPGCAPQPLIVWQTAHGKLEAANCGAGGLDNLRSISVGGPPLDVAIGGRAIRAAWATAAEIQGVEISEHAARSIRVAATFPDNIAIGACSAGACIAWTEGNSAFFARIAHEADIAETTIALDLPHADRGTLAVVSGPSPLIWSQRAQTIEDDDPHWTNSLVLPGKSPLIIEGLIHAAAWSGDVLAVVGSEEILFLQRVAGN